MVAPKPGDMLLGIRVVGLVECFLARVLAFYVKTFADYNAMYGSIGAIIVLLLYFYISSAVLLLGAEMNAVIEHMSAEGKNPGEKHSTRPTTLIPSNMSPALGATIPLKLLQIDRKSTRLNSSHNSPSRMPSSA